LRNNQSCTTHGSSLNPVGNIAPQINHQGGEKDSLMMGDNLEILKPLDSVGLS